MTRNGEKIVINSLKTMKQGIVAVPSQHATYQSEEGKDAFGDYGPGAKKKNNILQIGRGVGDLTPCPLSWLQVSVLFMMLKIHF